MMQLYFKNEITIVTTLLLGGIICYMCLLIKRRRHIVYWGRRTFVLILWGICICSKAATRDGFHLTVQNAIDGSTAPGLFSLISVPSIIGMLGAILILFSGIISIFVRKQQIRKILCYICMCGLALKIVIIELCRIVM